MPLLVVCDEGHSLLADPWERGMHRHRGAVLRLRGRRTPPGTRRPEEAHARTSPPGYDILGPLHGGVMAGVYRARHRRSGRQVALKLGASRARMVAGAASGGRPRRSAGSTIPTSSACWKSARRDISPSSRWSGCLEAPWPTDSATGRCPRRRRSTWRPSSPMRPITPTDVV